MHRTQRPLRNSALASSIILAAMLAGCGGGAESDTPAAADAAAYADTLSYCGSREPTGTAAAAGSLEITSPSRSSAPFYDVNAVVSPGGVESSPVPVRLAVDTNDYRGVTGSFFASGYADPASEMGAAFAAALPARAAACVVSLAKLTPVAATSAAAPGGYTLAWKSKWESTVPLAGLSGSIVDGFELVSDFTPSGGTVFFYLLKLRLASSQGLSICYRAPAGGSWDCAPATVTDAGTNWGAARAGAKPGVYVVTAPAAA